MREMILSIVILSLLISASIFSDRSVWKKCEELIAIAETCEKENAKSGEELKKEWERKRPFLEFFCNEDLLRCADADLIGMISQISGEQTEQFENAKRQFCADIRQIQSGSVLLLRKIF